MQSSRGRVFNQEKAPTLFSLSSFHTDTALWFNALDMPGVEMADAQTNPKIKNGRQEGLIHYYSTLKLKEKDYSLLANSCFPARRGQVSYRGVPINQSSI
jgi:hypothetical protein